MLPGKAQREVSRPNWLAARSTDASGRHVSDEYDRREGVSKALNPDRKRQDPERLAAIPAVRRKKRERNMARWLGKPRSTCHR